MRAQTPHSLGGVFARGSVANNFSSRRSSETEVEALRDGVVNDVTRPGLVGCAEKYSTSQGILQLDTERQRLIRRTQELETIVEMLRASESQPNQDVFSNQGKVNELMMRAAEKKFLEEQFAGAQQTLAEREEALSRLENEHVALEQEGLAQEAALTEQLIRYEDVVQNLEQHITTMERLIESPGFPALMQLRDRVTEADECGRVVSAELDTLRRVQSFNERSGSRSGSLSPSRPVAGGVRDVVLPFAQPAAFGVPCLPVAERGSNSQGGPPTAYSLPQSFVQSVPGPPTPRRSVQGKGVVGRRPELSSRTDGRQRDRLTRTPRTMC